MSVRLLFRVTEKKELVPTQAAPTEKFGAVRLSPAYPAQNAPNYEEQKTFYKWTPTGQIEFSTINEQALASLELGKDYYVTIEPVPSPEPAGKKVVAASE